MSCVDNYVASVGYSDGEVVWEEVFGELGFEDLCYVSCDYSLIAVGIPMSLSLVTSVGSLWRQNRYTSEK